MAESFSELTTLKVGGPIKNVVRCSTEEELVQHLSQEQNNFFILGGGSNILGSDEGYDGTVYLFTNDSVTLEEKGSNVLITASAGTLWDALVVHCVSKNLWGFENLSGIPGTVGGAVNQNIGAYGAVLAHTVQNVRVFDTKEKKICEFTKDECAFGYRTSVFKLEQPRYVIVSAQFLLTPHGQPNLSYNDLAVQFANDPSPRISSIRSAILGIRRRKFPDLNMYGTAGSFFLNPVVSKEEALAFQAQYPDMPVFPLPEGGVKVPLAWILDNVINAKELRHQGAFVWKEQALVITTEEGATANDVRALAKQIQKKVFEKTKITITPEVCFI